MDTNNNWVNWRPFDSRINNSDSISLSNFNQRTTSTTWVYSPVYAGSIAYTFGYSSSANNHTGQTIATSLLNKTSTQTVTYTHYNGTAGATEAITVEYIFGSEGFNQFRYKLSTYVSYTTQYGANIILSIMIINY